MSSLLPGRVPRVSGHVLRIERRKGPVWYVKYRGPDPSALNGQRGPTPARTRVETEAAPHPPGWFDEHTAKAALQATLTDLRGGIIDAARTGVTFAEAAEDWMVWGELERGWRRSTIVDRRSCLRRHLLPAFGHKSIDRITTQTIERCKIDWLNNTATAGKPPS